MWSECGWSFRSFASDSNVDKVEIHCHGEKRVAEYLTSFLVLGALKFPITAHFQRIKFGA